MQFLSCANVRLSRIPQSAIRGGVVLGLNAEVAEVAEDGINRISGTIIDAAMTVHSALGPGLLESAYEACLVHELHKRGLQVHSQVCLPVLYDKVRIDAGYRIDLLVEDAVIVELKTLERVLPVHQAQLLSYLRLSNKHLGLLINFHVPRLRDGIKRVVNNLQSPAASSPLRPLR